MTNWYDKLARVAQRNRQEIVHAKLSRRDMMRLGLLTSAGTLVVKGGLSSRAYAQVRLAPPSPPTKPWVQPLPILPIKTPVAPDKLTFGHPDGTTPTDGTKRRINHQLCSYDSVTGAYGGKFPP